RTRYWLTADASGGDVRAVGLAGADHPLLGAVVGLADGGWVLSGRVAADARSWLGDHVVVGPVAFPGTGVLGLALRAGGLGGRGGAVGAAGGGGCAGPGRGGRARGPHLLPPGGSDGHR